MNKKQNVSRSARFKLLRSARSFDVSSFDATVSISNQSTGKMLHQVLGDISNGACPLGGDEVECWMKYRKDYTLEGCNNVGSAYFIKDDAITWYKRAKTEACKQRGGRLGFYSGECYLPCARFYDTHDFTCTGWKNECVYWNWGLFGGYWTGCADTYSRTRVEMWHPGKEDEITSQPNRWQTCEYYYNNMYPSSS